MGIFDKVFKLFEKHEGHKELIETFSELNSIASTLKEELKSLIEMQKTIVKSRMARAENGQLVGPTGNIGLQKTLLINEEGSLKQYDLMTRLGVLESAAEKSFEKSLGENVQTGPITLIDKWVLNETKIFLHNIKKLIPSIDELRKETNEREKLAKVESVLIEIVKISKDYHKIVEREIDLIKSIEEHTISPLLKRIFSAPLTKINGEEIRLFKITHKELDSLNEESVKINQCEDPNYSVEWRRWHRDERVLEVDKKTTMGDTPHINVTIGLFGQKKKNIHLEMVA
ncbi:hypothetical protein HN992_00560 [Candidatus Woesearchaeota archaeon]|jgi:hypothetical protein|nr:hypothetical protein [Candidatus Woesearchaeota archaeon]MBT3438374.1 hypothetical protein [Candidatus Woesearchaeota archaeon]MBT4058371.1 hypothetical protein [Candidatus Woesearchaeota archaeon]MBT4207617.1 hypothetical protein [Candidatus Woesearchaeota archaeon]MBT4730620.1 hypothetical protein [Candidatus Woesearchaeota archaeon]